MGNRPPSPHLTAAAALRYAFSQPNLTAKTPELSENSTSENSNRFNQRVEMGTYGSTIISNESQRAAA
jgi:hypothetical protein